MFRLPSRPDLQRYAPHALLLLVLVVGLATLRDYGITFNEPMRARSGEAWWRFLATWDPSYLPESWLANYGALFDMLGVAVTRASRALGGHDEYLARHALVFLSGWLGLLGTYRLGRRVLAPAAALVALVLLFLTPRYYGASFGNPKDIPFAATFVWAMFGVVRLLQQPSPRAAAWCGVLAALCTAIRPFGVVFVALGALACVWPLVSAPARARRRLLAIQLASSIVLTIALWPILWVRPPWHVLQAVLALTNNPDAPMTLFSGKVYPGAEAPGTYVAVWTAITLPLPTLVFALGGLGVAAASGWRLWRSDRRLAAWGAGLLGVWVVAPIVVPLVHRTAMYSAMRHFLFILPPLCLLAGLGWHRLYVRRKERWQRVALVGVAVVAYGDVAITEARLHPYEDLYFSRVIGGLQGAAGRFEVSYYGETYLESFQWLAANTPPSAAPIHVNTPGGHLTVDVPAYYAQTMGMQYNTATFEYYLTPGAVEEQFPGTVVHTISREDVPLAIIVKVDPLEQPRSGWVTGPWTEIAVRDGRFVVPRDRDKLVLGIDSPRDQIVGFYLGYVGRAWVSANNRPPVRLPLTKPPIRPGLVHFEVMLSQGQNVLVIHLAEVERDAGIFVHYTAGRGLHSWSPPPP